MKLKKLTIFIVEDNEIYSKALENYLKINLKNNFTIHVFSKAEDCMFSLNLHPDIIILDYFLGDYKEDGLTILKNIKRISLKTEVILLSSQESIKVVTDAIKKGAFSYVEKDNASFSRIQHFINNIIEKLIMAKQRKINRCVKKVLVGLIILIGILIILFI